MSQRECLLCGMSASVSIPDFNAEKPIQHCPKCDSDLLAQTNGKCLTRDIAHQHETIPQALDKLEHLLNDAYGGYYQSVRVVVGGSLIKEEVLRQLYFYEQEGYILSYQEQAHNHGSILIQIRNPNDF